ncbi:MAG: hypothetical protein JSW07_22715 [bacterium]|nr:MAG: hypothetical protein JSW07_22715 [bacterium]
MDKLKVIIVATLMMLMFSPVNYLFSQDQPTHKGEPKPGYDFRDTNKDGKVSYEEHMADCQKRCGNAFKVMDRNGDGFITEEDRQAAMKDVEQRRKEMEERMEQMRKQAGDRPAPPRNLPQPPQNQ